VTVVTVEDPLYRVRLWIALAVAAVWCITFIAALLIPTHDASALILVQASMMAVLGGLWADRIRRRNDE
jgi:uncharacterized protein (DUF697 family)